MRILHYSLGFPPYRTGGLTKFCMDLMRQQIVCGHEVALMWPGKMGFIFHNISIRDRGNEYYQGVKIKSFEIINPLPISYDEGISKIDKFTYDGEVGAYRSFLDRYKPDIIHFHSLMGVHKVFLQAAKEKSIKLIFTAHDFFPICPKVTMFRRGQICESITNCNECGMCNVSALSMKKIQILQSPLYRKLKNTTFVKKLRKHHRDEYLSESTTTNCIAKPVGGSYDYKRLRMYYESMLKLMDKIHYNSSVTKEVYEKYFGEMPSITIPISHANILDQRKKKNFSNNIIRIRYLGPCGGQRVFLSKGGS